jgi:hypothetical protein
LVEEHLRRDTGIGASKDNCERSLAGRQFRSALWILVRTLEFASDKALVASLEARESLCRCNFRRLFRVLGGFGKCRLAGKKGAIVCSWAYRFMWFYNGDIHSSEWR